MTSDKIAERPACPDRGQSEAAASDYLFYLGALADEASQGQGKVLTLESIEAEPWRVVLADWPEAPDIGFLSTVWQQANCCALDARDCAGAEGLSEDTRAGLAAFAELAEDRAEMARLSIIGAGLSVPPFDPGRCFAGVCDTDTAGRSLFTYPRRQDVMNTEPQEEGAGLADHIAALETTTGQSREATGGPQIQAAGLAFAAAELAERQGQPDIADALRMEAEAREEIAAQGREPDPTPGGNEPARQWDNEAARLAAIRDMQAQQMQAAPTPEQTQDSQAAEFREAAESAARSFGFGKTANLIFMQTIGAAAMSQGTNPDIIFDENRESVRPGGHDYSSLQGAGAGVEAFEADLQAAGRAVDAPQMQAAPEIDTEAHLAKLDSAAQPQETMTRAVGIAPSPSGSVLYEYNHSPQDEGVREAKEAALEASNYAAPLHPSTMQPLEMDGTAPRSGVEAFEADLQASGQEAPAPQQEQGRYESAVMGASTVEAFSDAGAEMSQRTDTQQEAAAKALTGMESFEADLQSAGESAAQSGAEQAGPSRSFGMAG